jgi:glycine/D-amino acid oxidase-like deaminating enzyme
MKTDYLVVGGGLVGLATAWHLARTKRGARIRLLEQASRVTAGNSGKSAALYRTLFSSRTSRLLATSSATYYETIAAEIALVPRGYLWAFDARDWVTAASLAAELVAASPGTDILGPAELGRFLAPAALRRGPAEATGAIFGARAGSLSATALGAHYARLFVEAGGEILIGRRAGPPLPDAPADAWWEAKHFSGLVDSSGERHEAGCIVAAAGCWLQDLLGPAGIATGVYPKKRQLFAFRLPDENAIFAPGLAPERQPVVILPGSGIYLKPVPGRGLLIAGRADDLGRAFELPYEPVASAEPSYFRAAMEPSIREAFPALDSANASPLEIANAWAGHYDYYWPDRNPVVERRGDLVWVGGSSGSGIMKADAIGRIAAAAAAGDPSAELADGEVFPVSALSLRERAVDAEALVI